MTDEENHIVQHEEHSSQELPPTRVPIPVFILFFCIGFAPWLLVNGVWLQMADLVTVTSEHASIAAYLSLSLQFSNIVAFIYVIIQNYKPIPHNYSILFILIFNIITSLLFSFLWDKQTHIFGTTHSVALIILMFFAGMVGCLSVVVMYPWVSLYNVNLTSALSTGMGSSGLLASIIALIERPSDNIRLLSVDWFFRLLGIILCVSLICFIYVIKNDSINKLKTKQQQLKPSIDDGYQLVEGHEKETSWKHSLEIFHNAKVCILNQMFICLLSYTLLGILNYSVIGFSNSEELILWMNILSMIMGTVGRLFSSYYKFFKVTYLSVFQSFVWVFLFVMCVRGAEGLHPSTGWIIVIANTIYTAIYGYTDTVIYMKVGTEVESKYVEKSVRFVGLANQIGAFIGSITSFLLAELLL